MNQTIYKQLDSRWSKLPYPTKNSTFGGNGCGCVACTHIAIEQYSKRNWNPKALRKWMVKQGYAVAGQGTRWSGIEATLKHIGHKNVVWIQRKDPMAKAWKELDKGNRIGVMLVDNSRTPDRTFWTSSGHYVAFTAYEKRKDGKHWFYIKDSGFRNHDGWFCYEKSIAGALPQLWIVERLDGAPKKSIEELAKEVIDGKWGSGDERKQKLTEAGYDYDAVQKKVNEILAGNTLIGKILAACKEQAVWMKNYTYKWQANPTIEKSKRYGTCVTYVACVLQRLGYLKAGECIWHTSKGKVYGTNDRMTVTYYDGKTLTNLKSKLKAGDVVIVGKKSVTSAGDSGSHCFIFAGKWSGDNPYIWDNHSCTNVKKGKAGEHTYKGSTNVIAVITLNEEVKKKTNAQQLADKGWEYAYHSNSSDAKYRGGKPKAEYKAALDTAFGKTRKWQTAAKVGASCDVFVATCIRMAGIDKTAPRGLGRATYFDKSSKFEKVSVTAKTAQDGDIISIVWKNGKWHWCMVHSGKILEASLNGFYPKTTDTLASRLSMSGKKSVVVYRAK